MLFCRFQEYFQVIFLVKVGFTACLCKCWSLNFNLKKSVLIVIAMNAASFWLNDCWQTGPLFLSIITVRLFQGVSAVLQGFCLWDRSLSLLNIWCHKHFLMGRDDLFWVRKWKCISFSHFNYLIILHSPEQVFNSEKWLSSFLSLSCLL